MNTKQQIDVLLIGMGIAGISIARRISPKFAHRWMAVDKGRSVGGRMATRRVEAESFDHGAQFFTVRSEEFSQLVSELINRGVVKEWCHGFNEPGGDKRNDGFARYATIGGMNRLPKILIEDFDRPRIELNCKIQTLRFESDHFVATAQDGRIIKARHVVFTAPVPQSLDIAQGVLDQFGLKEEVQSLATINYDPCIAVLAKFNPSTIPDLRVPYKFAQGFLSFLSDNGPKGVSASSGALTIHLAADSSRKYFDQSDEIVVEQTLKSLSEIFPSSSFQITGCLSVQRWRYAVPTKVFDLPFLEITLVQSDSPRRPRIFFCGEAFGGPRIEGAFLSGDATGKRLLELDDQ